MPTEHDPAISTPPSPQDTIEPSDSISQASQRVPDIMEKRWIRKPRTGIRSERHCVRILVAQLPFNTGL